MLGSGINGTMLVATRTVDGRLEIERGYLAERRERKRMQFPAALFLRNDRLRFPRVGSPIPERVLTPFMRRGESTLPAVKATPDGSASAV
jgi:hypothetical protein